MTPADVLGFHDLLLALGVCVLFALGFSSGFAQ